MVLPSCPCSDANGWLLGAVASASEWHRKWAVAKTYVERKGMSPLAANKFHILLVRIETARRSGGSHRGRGRLCEVDVGSQGSAGLLVHARSNVVELQLRWEGL